MAGSYSHIVDKENNFTGLDCIDNLGDAWEALEECYDMIEYFSGGDKGKIALAHQYHIAKSTSPENAASLNLDGYFDDDAPIFNQEPPVSEQGKMKPCPNCECDKIRKVITPPFKYAQCAICGCRMELAGWNHRPTEDKLRAEVERLKCCGNCCFWRSGESKGEMNCQEFNNMPFRSRHHFDRCDHWGAKVHK